MLFSILMMIHKSKLLFFLLSSIFSHLAVMYAFFLVQQSMQKPLQIFSGSASLSVLIHSTAASASNVLDKPASAVDMPPLQKAATATRTAVLTQGAIAPSSQPSVSASTAQAPITNAEPPKTNNLPEALGPVSDPSKFEIDTKALAPNDKMPVGPFGSSSPHVSWGKLNPPIGSSAGTSPPAQLLQSQEMQKRQRKQVFLDAVKLRHQFILSNTENLACLAFINLDATLGSVSCTPPEATPQEIALLNGAVRMTATKPTNALCYPFGHVNAQLICP